VSLTEGAFDTLGVVDAGVVLASGPTVQTTKLTMYINQSINQSYF